MNDEIQFIPIEDMIPDDTVMLLSETQNWGDSIAHIAEAHKFSTGEGITVAVLDTGKPEHIDLNDNIIDFGNGTDDQSPNDAQGHSSHVCGIIAAIDNGEGVIGVAPKAKLIPIKVLNNQARGNYGTIMKGLRLAIDKNVDVINMSLGAGDVPPPEFYDLIKEAYNKGIIMVAAAGNNAGNVLYPAKYDEIIAVAAVDTNKQLAHFSSRGDTVDVSAPGVNIYSTHLNNSYAILNGTSQASPFVAGVCALMLSWSRNHQDATPIKNGQDMLKVLDELCDTNETNDFPTKHGNLGFGIPDFANYKPWKNEFSPMNTEDVPDYTNPGD